MSNVYYPDKEDIEWWMNHLRGENPVLDLSLPVVDQNWSGHILNLIDLLKLSAYPEDVHHKAALLFYKIIKNHNYIDGNKRSGVVMVYLFYLVNGCMLQRTIDIQAVAKRVAASRPSRVDKWVHYLECEFREHTKIIRL